MNEPYIVTFSGQRLSLVNPQPESIQLIDIAHHLAMMPRFTGALARPYTVAQHCITLCSVVSAEAKLCALMHDAAEAYIGDISTPLKGVLPEVRIWEQTMLDAILRRFDLWFPDEVWAEVKEADLRMAKTEYETLKRPDVPEIAEWKDIEPYETKLFNFGGHFQTKMAYLEIANIRIAEHHVKKGVAR